MARHYAYRCSIDNLNQSYERIDDDDGQVVQTIHLGGRDFVIVYAKQELRHTADPAEYDKLMRVAEKGAPEVVAKLEAERAKRIAGATS